MGYDTCITPTFIQEDHQIAQGESMTDPIKQRIEHLQERIVQNQLQGIALNPGPDLSYFSGLGFHLMERPVLWIIPQQGSPVLILPELEEMKIRGLPFEVRPFTFNEDPSTWTNVFQLALTEAGCLGGSLGVIPRRLRLLELSYIQEAAPGLVLTSAQEIISKMRMIKGEAEIQRMSEAARIAECALSATLGSIKPGVTEKEIAAKLVSCLLQNGSDPELPFFPIVSFGENAANGHAIPGNRVLQEGDLVLIDWGASHDGYFSDITRVFEVGDIQPELEKIAQFVREANAAGRAVVKPGVLASEVDKAARKVITDAGYGEFFIHRTGHGLGLEVHEEPYISAFDNTELLPGMTFTIEPGIYLPNRGGVRIEDDILVTEDGCRSLTGLPRELTQLMVEDDFI
jgi:Xaa-Pro dipeptidase